MTFWTAGAGEQLELSTMSGERAMQRGGSVPAALCAAALALAVTLAPRSSRGDDRELRRIGEETGTLGVTLKAFVDSYAEVEEIARVRPFSERMTDGEILFLLGDHVRASLVLYDLVTDRRNAAEPLYDNAVYYLAESLFQIGHDLAAREHFGRLVERRDSMHLTDAIRRLIQIADRNRRWEGLEAHVAVLEAQGRLPADVAYIRAKSLLRQGKPAEAMAAAAGVPADHPLALKAAYLAAVALLEQGDLEASHKAFASLAQPREGFDDAGEVREMSAMNAGRILLEQGKFGESIDAYQEVPRSSPMFDETLYEITWTFVRAADQATTEAQRRAEYEKARNALDILLLSEAENPVAPEARLLLGSILLRLGANEEAGQAFAEVVERYAPVRDAIRELAERRLDPEAYFEEIAAGKQGRTGMLPRLAVHWATDHGQLRSAFQLISSLDESQASLGEAAKLVAKLLVMLESEHRVSFFPALQEVQARVLEYRNTMTALHQRLLTAERELVADALSPEWRAQLDDVLAERAALEPEYRKLPQRKEEFEDRLEGVRGRLRDLERQAYTLRYDVGSLRAQTNAVKVWIVQHRGEVPQDARSEYEESIGRVEAVISELEAMQRDIEERIAREKGLISITTAQQGPDEELRVRYTDLLAREREILASASHGGPHGAQLAEVERLRGVLATYRAELEQFGRHLDEQVRRKSVDIAAAILKEQGAIEHCRDQMEIARRDARRVIGNVAEKSLDGVRQKFHNIVLRADVGIVDVVWARKEEQTQEISQRVNEQRRELQLLDGEFADILRED